MRTLLCGILVLMMVPTIMSDSENPDPYWTSLVKTELDLRVSGPVVYTSFTQKNLPKLGDCAAIALLKLLDTNKTVPSNIVTASLSIIRDAFSRPELIAVESDREPKVTICLLALFDRSVSDKQTLQDIEKTRQLIQQQARK